MSKKIIIILFLILAIATVLRFYKLGDIPPSPDWDEVALGYDAYSIIHTGRDEYGKFLPVVLRSFDDYKPALYAYLSVPSVFFFGLNEFSVRFPSALLGVLTVFATFFLVKELFKRNEIALLASFFLAISPWHIQFSRVGFESNIGVAFNVFMALFFIKAFRKPYFLLFSAFFAGLNQYIYQSDRVFTPLLLLALVIIYWKDLFKISKKYLLTSVILGLIVVLPMIIYIATDKQALLRVSGTSIFSSQTELLKNDIPKLLRDTAKNDKIGLILDNRRFTFAKIIASNYLSHFNLNWLFITGDIARHHAPQMGLLYLFELPFLFIGLYIFIFGQYSKKTKLLIIAWFLITPIPASITTGVPHAVRTLNFLPTFQIFIAIGLITAIKLLSNIKFWKIFAICYLLFAIFNFSYYLNQYFVQLNYFNSQEWQYGYKQAVSEVKNIGGNYPKIVVSDKEPLDKSYMFFLFYLQYPPFEYQKVGQYQSGGFAAHHNFDKYEFRPIDWQKDSKAKNVLYIGTPGEFPPDIDALKVIYNKDGTPAIKLVRT
ncbi:MAG: glycosyltransferase family 39 protein [Candidatus Levyibacteriota bacterium]